MRKWFSISFCLLLLFACKKGKNNPKSCNGSSTRREVKLITDEDAAQIDTIPIVATIDSLVNLDLIEADKNTPRQSVEKHIFKVTAKVDKLSKHRDGDYKIKLVDGDENYLNCEVPNPGCEYAPGSPYYEHFNVIRSFIKEHEDHLEGKTLTVTGVGFIDIPHPYPRKAAPNDFELHPIIALNF